MRSRNKTVGAVLATRSIIFFNRVLALCYILRTVQYVFVREFLFCFPVLLPEITLCTCIQIARVISKGHGTCTRLGIVKNIHTGYTLLWYSSDLLKNRIWRMLQQQQTRTPVRIVYLLCSGELFMEEYVIMIFFSPLVTRTKVL